MSTIRRSSSCVFGESDILHVSILFVLVRRRMGTEEKERTGRNWVRRVGVHVVVVVVVVEQVKNCGKRKEKENFGEHSLGCRSVN